MTFAEDASAAGAAAHAHAGHVRGDQGSAPRDAAVPVMGFGDVLGDVLGDAPAAVLMVDLESGRVVYVNEVAQQLAPGAELPTSCEVWSDAAGLRDLAGGLLSVTDHPLTRVARSEPVNGQAVSAARPSDLGVGHAPLWVIALPLERAPHMEGFALVVMLPLRLREVAVAARDQGAGGGPDDLSSRAVLATGLSFTVADAMDPDLPLVWVNPAFTATTGYSFEESVGRNCRFLQGPGTDPAERRRVRESLRAGRAVTATLLNYRRDGTAYWNQVTMSPIRDASGLLTHFVGIQADVSGRVDADRARDRALAEAEGARAAAEAAEDRVRRIADVTVVLASSSSIPEGRERLMQTVVPELADMVAILHVDDLGRVSEIDSAHADAASDGLLAELTRTGPAALRDGPVVDTLLGPSGSRLLTGLDTASGDEARRAFLADDAYLVRGRQLEMTSAIFVPLAGRSEVRDVMIMARSAGRVPFSQPDLDAALDLGRRAGLVMENLRLVDAQRRIAETLQRSLLSELPAIEGIRSAARYHVGASNAEVGGDFYELGALEDGRIALAVGDVVGHDMIAAAAMGHLKGAIRACASEPGISPAGVLTRVCTLMQRQSNTELATALQAFMVADAEGWSLTLSSAAHPPLVARRPDGRVDMLEVDNDGLLGLGSGPRRDHAVRLPHGTTLVGYTDGLIERRGEPLDVGMKRLVDEVRTGPGDLTQLVDHLIERLPIDVDDDVAVVALSLLRP